MIEEKNESRTGFVFLLSNVLDMVRETRYRIIKEGKYYLIDRLDPIVWRSTLLDISLMYETLEEAEKWLLEE